MEVKPDGELPQPALPGSVYGTQVYYSAAQVQAAIRNERERVLLEAERLTVNWDGTYKRAVEHLLEKLRKGAE